MTTPGAQGWIDTITTDDLIAVRELFPGQIWEPPPDLDSWAGRTGLFVTGEPRDTLVRVYNTREQAKYECKRLNAELMEKGETDTLYFVEAITVDEAKYRGRGRDWRRPGKNVGRRQAAMEVAT